MQVNTVNTLEHVDPDERLVAVIKRHFFGIFKVYVQAIIGLAAGVTLMYLVLPEISGTHHAQLVNLVRALSVSAVLLAIVILFVATIIYRESRLIVTDKNITQVIQQGIFIRRTSQLSLANVEDVTAEQKGFFATILNFGTLRVETAGEMPNFYFAYCPHPNRMAQEITSVCKYIAKHKP